MEARSASEARLCSPVLTCEGWKTVKRGAMAVIRLLDDSMALFTAHLPGSRNPGALIMRSIPAVVTVYNIIRT